MLAIPPIVGAFQAMPALIVAVWLWLEGTSLSIAPLNFLVNIAGAIAVVYAIIKVGKSKVKDDTIKDLQNSIEAKDGRLRDLSDEAKAARQQSRQIEQAAHVCQTEAATWRAKYEEQAKYTAPEAIGAFLELAKQTERNQERRHKEIMQAFEALNAAITKS